MSKEIPVADISADKVKQLREATGAGMMDCKRALQETNGDLEKAKDWLRQKGMAKAATKAGRTASQGLVHAYIHHNGQLGVLVELNSESDFVARNEEFRHLAHELAVHIAAANPRWLRREDVPAEILSREKAIYDAQARELKRPENVLPKIVEGKLKDFYKQDVLLDQPFAKDDARTVAEVIKEAIAKLGENITISRFARFRVGRPALQAGAAQAERGGADVPRWVRHRPGHRAPDRRGSGWGYANVRYPGGDRDGRRQHHPRRDGQRQGDEPGHGGLHGHAGHGHQRPGAARRAGTHRATHAGAVGDPDGPGGRALYLAPGRAPPGERPSRYPGRRHGQSLLFDGYHGGPAGGG